MSVRVFTLHAGYPGRVTAKKLPRAFRSRMARLSRTVLIVGSLAAAALAFGSPLVARIGVAVAVLTAIVATWSAWREYNDLRHRTSDETTAAMAAHGKTVKEERARHLGVMDTLHQRNEGLREELKNVINTNEKLEAEVVGLREDNTELVAKNESLTMELAEVREQHTALTADHVELEQRHGELQLRLAELEVHYVEGDVVDFEERRPA